MQRTAVLSIILVASCGGQPAESQPVRLATPIASATAAPPAPEPLGVPHDAPLVATLETSAALSALAPFRAEIEHELGVPAGVLPADLADAGLDPKRPLVFAFDPLGKDAEKLVSDLRSAPPPKASDAARRTYAAPLLLGYRLLLPATDPPKLAATMKNVLSKGGWKAQGEAFVLPHRVATVTADASWVALDLGLAAAVSASREALDDVLRGPLDPPPALERWLHVTWSPARVAPLAFLSGVQATIGAVSGEGVRPDVKERVFAEGLEEAGAAFTLAERDGKAYFDRVDLTASLTPFDVTVRAHPGPALAMPPAGDFAASTALSFPGARAELSGSVGLMSAWGFPADQQHLAHQGGELAQLIALPELLAEAPRELPISMHDAGPADALVSRFERVGESWTQAGNEIWYGVLPQKTTRSGAQCSLAQGPCAGATKLPVGKTTKAGLGFAKVVDLDHRWVLLLAKDAGSLDAAKGKTTSAQPLHVEADTKEIAAKIPGLPAHVVGDVATDGRDVVFHFAAP